jgi:hypothetical protein
MSHTYRGQPGAIVVPAGRYFASLANNGERIESIDAIGRVIHSVRYDGAWAS